MQTEELLLNWGARIGAAAYLEYVKSSQLENLLATLDVIESREALLLIALFAQRQARRSRIGNLTAGIIRQAMLDLYEKNLTKRDAREVLGIAKWVHEALQGSNVKLAREQLSKLTLHELLEKLTR